MKKMNKMKKIFFVGICIILVLFSIAYAAKDNTCNEKISVFGINDDYEIEWRIQITTDEFESGFKVPYTENVTTMLIVYDNVLIRSYELER